jgi:hypothetical protein
MKIFNMFRNKHEILDSKIKKKKKKLRNKKLITYWLFSFLFMSLSIAAVSFRFGLYDKDVETGVKINGYVLIVFILILYFGFKKMVGQLKKWTDRKQSKWLEQFLITFPLFILLLFLLYLNQKIADIIYIIQ